VEKVATIEARLRSGRIERELRVPGASDHRDLSVYQRRAEYARGGSTWQFSKTLHGVSRNGCRLATPDRQPELRAIPCDGVRSPTNPRR
jgi:hypothetical protein